MTIVIGLWIVPLLLSFVPIVWFFRHDYSGSYNFTALFTAPVAALGICFVWLIYFMMLAVSA